jgi:hypothetical protein
MTCEITYKADPINKRRLSLEPLPTPLRLSNVGLFNFMDRVVMSYLNIRYDHRSKHRKCVRATPRKITHSASLSIQMVISLLSTSW